MQNFDVLNHKTIVFIGGGNMASAIISGLLDAKHTHQLSLTLGVSDTDSNKLNTFAKQGVLTSLASDAQALIEQADVVVLAIKPQILADIAPTIAPFLHDKLVLSILAGVSTQTLSQALNTQNIVRAMPNLPASIGMGATGLFSHLTDTPKQLAEQIMQSCGITMWVNDEALLHAVTAVAGSAPAYFFYVLEHMVAQGVNMGLQADDAKALASQSMIGAGMLAKTADPVTLRSQVTSKGGTTAVAISVLQAQDVGSSFALAMQACAKRSQELGSC